MLLVQVFNSIDEDFLTKKINKWLVENKDCKVRDIKFSSSCSSSEYDNIYCCSAMIIYEA